MSLTRFPNGISSFGIPIMGSGSDIPVTTGTYFFVDSATGSNANDGKDKDHPVATIDYAIGLCTANKGDVIIVMPNHAETLSTAGAIDCDVEGVTIVGLGQGLNRPTLTFTGTGSSLADVDIDADSVKIKNLYFVIDSTGTKPCIAPIDVNDGYFTLENCEFRATTVGGGIDEEFIVTDGSGLDHLRILNNKFIIDVGCSGTANSAIDLVGTTVGNCCEISGNIFDCHTVAEGIIHATSNSNAGMGDLTVSHNVFLARGGVGPLQLGATTVTTYGSCHHNLYYSADTTDYPTTAKLAVFENYYCSATGQKSGMLYPAIWSS